MPRRREVPKREILPDPLYNSQLVTKFINSVMSAGKKAVAEGILYGALNKVAAKSGLASTGLNFNVPVQNKVAAAAQAATCQVLDLVLGPVDLNLLGLMVHLDVVHLSITADPTGGVLGSLFCSLTH